MWRIRRMSGSALSAQRSALSFQLSAFGSRFQFQLSASGFRLSAPGLSSQVSAPGSRLLAPGSPASSFRRPRRSDVRCVACLARPAYISQVGIHSRTLLLAMFLINAGTGGLAQSPPAATAHGGQSYRAEIAQ